MNYIVIGGAGFVGFHLSQALIESGYQVTLIDNLSNSKIDKELSILLKSSNVTFHNIDASSDKLQDFLDRESIVLNLAAINGTEPFYSKPFDVLYDSSLPSLSIPKACVLASVKEYYYFGSSESYAGGVNLGYTEVPTKENVPLIVESPENPRWSYATAKILGEMAALSAHSQYGLQVGIFRLHNIYGPRMETSHVVPDLIEKFSKGILEVFNCKHTRSFMYIDDAVKAILTCIQTGFLIRHPSRILNIGSGQETTIFELAQMILRLQSKEGEIRCIEGHLGSVTRRLPDITKMREFYTDNLLELPEGLKLMMKHKYSNKSAL
jgi:nucleoside-diphosphate-sugar epimerase